VKSVIVFSSSVGTFVGGGSKSYIDMLREDYTTYGLWANGLTIIHALKFVGQMLYRNCSTIILHVGAVEAFTNRAPYFLHCTIHDMILNHLNQDQNFMAYVAPNMLRAARELDYELDPDYYRRVEPEDFRTLLRRFATFSEGFRVLVLGMTHPWVGHSRAVEQTEQAREYDNILKDVCAETKHMQFVPLLDITSGKTIDTCHMTTEGHAKVYDERIKPLLEA